MNETDRIITDLETVRGFLGGLAPTGYAGVDSNIETALECVRFALLALAADLSPAVAGGFYDLLDQTDVQS